MKLEGDYTFEAPVEEVWKALLDPAVLAAVMPGCEKLDLVDGQYVGELNIKVGPVQGKFSGKVDLKDMQAPTSYTMHVDGRGAPGFVKATAQVQLASEGEKTRMRYDADAQVGGKIASVGQRLLEASSRAITKQSLEGLNENIKIRASAARAARSVVTAVPAAHGASAASGGGPSYDDPPTAAPAVQFKPIDQRALATAVAKEVSRSLLPSPAVLGIGMCVVALIVWLWMRG